METNNANAITTFAFGDALVRVIEREDGPWWVAGDVAKVLGYDRQRDMTRWLDEDQKGAHKVPPLYSTNTPPPKGGAQVMVIISESGLYTAIFNSHRPEAKVFRKWVTSEVLPAIRRTGGYGVSGDMAKLQELVNRLIGLVEELTKRQIALEALVASQQAASSPRLGADYEPGVHSIYLDKDDGWWMGKCSPWHNNPPMRQGIISRYRRMTLTQAHAELQADFPGEHVPSAVTISRFWLNLDMVFRAPD